MNFDRPPRIAGPRLPGRTTCFESEVFPQINLHMTVLHLDQTPTKPLRSACWDAEAEDCVSSNNTESTIDVCLLSPTEDDEKSAGHSTVFSDITDPSAFNSSTNSYIDSSGRQDSLECSLRIEALGPLHEELDDKVLFEIPDRELLRSSSQDRAVFDTEGKDTPPQLATRLHSSFEWTEASPLIVNDRFGSDDRRDQDKPMKLPRSSYWQHASIPAPSALPKLAETFRSGCSTGTHTYRLKKYPNTFVGSEAVDFMLSANLASTREDAVFLGQRFCKELNLFHHVHWDHSFKDGHYFYRFNDESFAQLSKEDLVRLTEKFAEGILPVSKRMRRRFKTYRNTFFGEEAVNYMLQAKLASSRAEAVFLGQRMMEELNIFEPVSHNSRFKDSCYLYRLITENNKALCFDASTEAIAHHHQNSPQSPVASSGCLKSSTIGDRRKNSKVSFGKVQIRCFERRLECNPATNSGPSLGLGWRFCDDSPIPLLGDENSGVLELRGGRLSVEERTAILKEWGYGKADISKATKLNKIIRKQRKRSLNKDTSVKRRST